MVVRVVRIDLVSTNVEEGDSENDGVAVVVPCLDLPDRPIRVKSDCLRTALFLSTREEMGQFLSCRKCALYGRHGRVVRIKS